MIHGFWFDTVAVRRRVAETVLVIQASNGLQLSRADAQQLASARTGMEPIPIAGMNRVWKIPEKGPA